MTGGGRSKISGKMGQQSAIVDKISPREFERMERSINMEEINYEITAIVENLTKTKPNMAAIAEYKKKEEVYLERVSELDKITGARDEQRKHHDDLRKQRLNDFMDG